MGHHKPMHLPQHDRAVLVEERSEMPPCDYEMMRIFSKKLNVAMQKWTQIHPLLLSLLRSKSSRLS